MRHFWVAGLVGLIACGGDKDAEGTDTGGGTTDPTGCTNSISETFPADGTADAYYRTGVEFTLLTAEADATIAVVDGAGAAVAGTSMVEGNVVMWMPSAPLAAATSYTATLSYSCDDASISFTTSDVGAPIGDSSALVGNVYALPLTEGRFVEPPGVGEILSGLLTVGVLIEVTSADASSITMMGAVAAESDPNAQDLCTETIDFPTAADFSENPYFQVGPDDTVISVAGISIAIDDLAISGAFSPSGDAIEGAALSGSIDTRPLVPLVAEGQGDDGVCNLVATFGIPCIECADGSGAYCLALKVDSMSADQVPGGDVVQRTADDVANDPTCSGT
jgi:hypothetical protein